MRGLKGRYVGSFAKHSHTIIRLSAHHKPQVLLNEGIPQALASLYTPFTMEDKGSPSTPSRMLYSLQVSSCNELPQAACLDVHAPLQALRDGSLRCSGCSSEGMALHLKPWVLQPAWLQLAVMILV
jgi:hypothetical protein